ncbi:hypothetical protein JCM11641_002722 [Rhodosporidiobolus odoratus]
MQQGDRNAPSTFARRMNDEFGDLYGDFVWVYLDDIFIYSNGTLEDHYQKVRTVLKRFRAMGMRINPLKFNFVLDRIKALGRIISGNGIEMDEEKIKAFLSFTPPTTPKGLQSLLGLLNWIAPHVFDVAGGASPLYKRSAKAKADYRWTSEHDDALAACKERVARAFPLKPVDYGPESAPLHLVTDASKLRVAAYLAQGEAWETARPVGFYSHVCTDAESRYPQHDLEMLAVVGASKHFGNTLHGKEIHVWTDSTYVVKSAGQEKIPNRRLRWEAVISKYHYRYHHIPGLRNLLADALSRLETTLKINTPSITTTFDEEDDLVNIPSSSTSRVNAISTRSRKTEQPRKSYSDFRYMFPPLQSRPPPATKRPRKAKPQPPVFYSYVDHSPDDDSSVEPLLPIDSSGLPASAPDQATSDNNTTSNDVPITTDDSSDVPPLEPLEENAHVRQSELNRRNEPIALGFEKVNLIPQNLIDITPVAIPPTPPVEPPSSTGESAGNTESFYSSPPHQTYTIDFIINHIKGLYAHDDFCKEIVSHPERYDDFRLKDGQLFWFPTRSSQEGRVKTINQTPRLVVPTGKIGSRSAREIVLSHCHRVQGHLGVKKLREFTRLHFFWPTLLRDANDFGNSCDVCQANKASTSAPIGYAHPLEIPLKPWMDIGMDFVGPLPSSIVTGQKAVNFILTIVDRLSLGVILIPCNTTDTASHIGKLFYKHFYRYHGVPLSITCDRDTRWESDFWKAFNDLAGSTIKLSTAFHPETDGSTENANGVLGQVLRCLLDQQQDKWASKLIATDFAMNSSISASTGYAPFELIHGYLPSPLPNHATTFSILPSATDYYEELLAAQECAHDALIAARTRQAIQTNKHRSPPPTYQVGDTVFLSLQNLRLPPNVSRKLSARFLKTTVKGVLPKDVYELDLPSHLGIHPRFHTCLICPYKANDDDRFPSRYDKLVEPPQLNPEIPQGETEIDRFLQHKWLSEGRYFLLRFVGQGAQNDEWFHESDLKNATSFIRAYEKQHPSSEKPPQ